MEEAAKAYYDIKEELVVSADYSIVFRGTCIIPPSCLWDKAVKTAHEGHQGIVKTKALLRTKIWFPGMDKLVERAVSLCQACQVVSGIPKREPLKMSELLSGPWKELASDFYGPLASSEYLRVLRYPVVEIINQHQLIVLYQYWTRHLHYLGYVKC